MTEKDILCFEQVEEVERRAVERFKKKAAAANKLAFNQQTAGFLEIK